MGSLPLNSLKHLMKAMLDTRGFDRVLSKVNILSASPGKLVCELRVEEEHTNRGGTLHGGMTATLVDVISTVAIMNTERGAPGVSVDMNITFPRLAYRLTPGTSNDLEQMSMSYRYMSAAKMGEDVLITAEVLKQGRTLAFASVDLTSKVTGKMIAQGRHTKHLGSS